MNAPPLRSAAALAGLLLVSACSLFNDPTTVTAEPVPGAACAAIERMARDKTPTAQEVVVVIDRSPSMRDAETGQSPGWYAAIFGGRGVPQQDGSISFGSEAALIPSIGTPAVIRIGTIDGGESITWQGAPIYLPRMTGGDRNRQIFAGNTSACLRERIGQAVREPAAERGSNVMAAFQVGTQETSRARRTLVIATDGLATTGCADLRQTAMRDIAHAKRIVRACARQRAVPELKGWEVLLPWVGVVGPGHPEPEEPHRQWLRTLWTEMCAEVTGAKDGCQVRSADRPQLAEGAAAAKGAADEPVRFRPIATPPNPVRTETLPSDLLFDVDSDRISAKGRKALEAFAEKVIPKAPEWVEVAGHTDDQGDEAYNKDLSLRRAEAVRRVLEDAGLGGIRVVGKGETSPKCPGTSAAARQCNRRVEIKYKVRG